MLILRRKVGERIVIGDGIVVVVSRVAGGRVTLGIEAPSDVHIVRGELQNFAEKAEKPAVSLSRQPKPMAPIKSGAPAHLVVALSTSAAALPH